MGVIENLQGPFLIYLPDSPDTRQRIFILIPPKRLALRAGMNFSNKVKSEWLCESIAFKSFAESSADEKPGPVERIERLSLQQIKQGS